MKIQKIIVDEIPEKCYFCDLCVDLADGDGYRCIGITNSDAQDNRLGYSPAELPFRRHDCPLIGQQKVFISHPAITKEIVDAVEEYNKRSLDMARRQRDAAAAKAAKIDNEKIRDFLLKNPPTGYKSGPCCGTPTEIRDNLGQALGDGAADCHGSGAASQ